MKNDLIVMLKKIKPLIKKSHLVLPKNFSFQFYHHRGVENFGDTGAVFINIVNKDYCKSYAILIPGQKYPNHYHKIKTETFFVLYGDLTVECEGVCKTLGAGDIMTINRGQSHLFYSNNGAVFEELSTTYIKNDSIYEDEMIRRASYDFRKTVINSNDIKEEYENA